MPLKRGFVWAVGCGGFLLWAERVRSLIFKNKYQIAVFFLNLIAFDGKLILILAKMCYIN